jgi:hypothetical protein
MGEPDRLELRFLVPIKQDISFGTGDLHPYQAWEWLTRELVRRYGGWTGTTALQDGGWVDPQTGLVVIDQSREYRVAMPSGEVDNFFLFLKEVGIRFRQKSIYCCITGKAVFVESSG